MRTPPHLLLAFVALLTVAFAFAETLACPDLRPARRVEPCPTEAELRYTSIGFCSDNARLYDGKAEACVGFAAYRKVTNIALWASADGALDRGTAFKPCRVICRVLGSRVVIYLIVDGRCDMHSVPARRLPGTRPRGIPRECS